MSTIFALLLIASGLAIMAFGLFFFYAWLPLLYALVGLDVGLLLGRSLTGEMGTMSIVFGIVGAVVLGAASYFLEPYRRIMIGAFGGSCSASRLPPSSASRAGSAVWSRGCWHCFAV